MDKSIKNIKIRAWDKTDQVVREVVGMSFYHEAVSVDIGFGDYLQDDAQRFELMQYTGLRDKNGTDIYEGDIIWDARKENHGEVSFGNGMYCVEWPTYIELLFEVAADSHTEVIGNIYENPELLERGCSYE